MEYVSHEEYQREVDAMRRRCDERTAIDKLKHSKRWQMLSLADKLAALDKVKAKFK